MAFDQFREAE